MYNNRYLNLGISFLRYKESKNYCTHWCTSCFVYRLSVGFILFIYVRKTNNILIFIYSPQTLNPRPLVYLSLKKYEFSRNKLNSSLIVLRNAKINIDCYTSITHLIQVVQQSLEKVKLCCVSLNKFNRTPLLSVNGVQ